MHLRFDRPLSGDIVEAYEAPYPDPINVQRGDALHVDPERSKETDISGWVWCIGPDGREGWVPKAWIDASTQPPVIRRDYSARELTVRIGDRVEIYLLESGFALCAAGDAEPGWLPQGVLRVAREADRADARLRAGDRNEAALP